VTIYKRCELCGQSLQEDHISVYDCLRALIKRVEKLEDELLARKLEGGLPSLSDSDTPKKDSSPPESLRSLTDFLVKGD